MKKIPYFTCMLIMCLSITSKIQTSAIEHSVFGMSNAKALFREISLTGQNSTHAEFTKIPNVAQYQSADWDNSIGIASGVSVEKAIVIANENPEITYFFYAKDAVLLDLNYYGMIAFNKSTAVFFSGEPHWGSKSESDGYVRVME
jgi:hypothetical protein